MRGQDKVRKNAYIKVINSLRTGFECCKQRKVKEYMRKNLIVYQEKRNGSWYIYMYTIFIS